MDDKISGTAVINKYRAANALNSVETLTTSLAVALKGRPLILTITLPLLDKNSLASALLPLNHKN